MALSALRLRLVLASVFTPLFVAAAALLWYWSTQTGPGDAPGSGSIRTLAVACTVLAALALADLCVVLRRVRRARTAAGEGRRDGASGPGGGERPRGPGGDVP